MNTIQLTDRELDILLQIIYQIDSNIQLDNSFTNENFKYTVGENVIFGCSENEYKHVKSLIKKIYEL